MTIKNEKEIKKIIDNWLETTDEAVQEMFDELSPYLAQVPEWEGKGKEYVVWGEWTESQLIAEIEGFLKANMYGTQKAYKRANGENPKTEHKIRVCIHKGGKE